MTSSETSTEPPDRRDRRGGGLFVLGFAGVSTVAGWAFVLWHHHFRITAPGVVLMLGWTAVVASVYFLWRTADNADLDDAEDWWKATGRREELVREKKSLLKAIKETEADRDTGKLSKEDSDELIARYRARAIDVIKAIEEGDVGAVDLRERIEREVRARVSIDGVADRKKKAKAAKAEKAEKADKKLGEEKSA